MSTGEVVEVSNLVFPSHSESATIPALFPKVMLHWFFCKNKIALLQIQLIGFILYGQVYDLNGYEM